MLLTGHTTTRYSPFISSAAVTLLQSKTQLVTYSVCFASFNMDVLTAWAVANPAMARLLWVLVLMLVTLLLWLCFCCYSWNQSASPSLEKYLAGTWWNFCCFLGLFFFHFSFQNLLTYTLVVPFQGKSDYIFQSLCCVGSKSTWCLELLWALLLKVFEKNTMVFS